MDDMFRRALGGAIEIETVIAGGLWNTFVDPDPTDPHKRTMTVWGQGTVNVNTANAQTLLAIVCANAPDGPRT